MFNARQLPEMPSKNRYRRHSKISEARFRHLLYLFAMDLTATDAAQPCGLSVRSVNALYQRMRIRLDRQCAAQSPFSGELEADESYFGPKRIRGKNVGVARVAKPSSLVCSSKATVSIPISLPMPPKPHCKPLFGAK